MMTTRIYVIVLCQQSSLFSDLRSSNSIVPKAFKFIDRQEWHQHTTCLFLQASLKTRWFQWEKLFSKTDIWKCATLCRRLTKHKNGMWMYGIVISFSYGCGVQFSRIWIYLMLLAFLFCFTSYLHNNVGSIIMTIKYERLKIRKSETVLQTLGF